MPTSPPAQVFAVVTTRPEAVPYGGTGPVLVAQDAEEQERIAMWISRITNAIVHDLHNGVVLLVMNLPEAGGGGGA
jgi:hypothetical protein